MNNRFLQRWGPYFVLLAEVVISYRNILLGNTLIPWDIRAFHLQQALFVSKALHSGELPLWTPFIYCGHPFAANIQAALFYPPRFIATLFGGITAKQMLYSLEIELILHVWLAGAFSFWLLRECKVPLAASLLGATSFELGAFFASQAEHLGAMEAAAWLPAIWLLIVRLSRQVTRRNVVLLSGAISMSVFAGFTPLTTVSLASSALLVLLLIAYRQARIKLLVVFVLCAAGSLLLSAVVFFPAAELALLSVGRFRSDWVGNGGGLPLTSLYSLVWPGSFGVLERGQYKGPYDITLMYLYSGLLILVGAVLSFRKRRLSNWGPIALLFLISTLFMLGASTPFGSLYGHLFPATLRGVIYPQEWIAPFSLCLCALGAFGFSEIANRKGIGVALVFIAIVDLIWAGSNRPFNSVSPAVEPGVTETAFAGSQQLLASVRAAAEGTTPPARIDTVDDSLDWVGSAMITDVPTAGGADPMALIRYIQVRLALTKGERWGYYYQVSNMQAPVLPALNVCCILTRKKIAESSAYSQVEEVPGGLLYRTPAALPRFYLVHKTIPARDMAESAVLIRRTEWNPREVAVTEGFPGLTVQKEVSKPQDGVSIISYRRNAVRVETESNQPAFLASSETNYPGWKATIDGRPAPIYTTNVAFRGLAVPAGKHVVDFHFASVLLAISASISVLAWAGFVLVLLR